MRTKKRVRRRQIKAAQEGEILDKGLESRVKIHHPNQSFHRHLHLL